MTRNTLGDLQNHIFDAIERLMDADDPDELEREITRGEAVADLGRVAIQNANTAMKAMRMQASAEVAIEKRDQMKMLQMGAGESE